MLCSIALTTDFSDLSRKPFGAAAALAKKFNARLFLIHLEVPVFNSIAVTTDFSEASRVAFGAAAALAKRFQARLYVLHVAQHPQIFTAWQIAEQSPAESCRRLAETQTRLQNLAFGEPAFAGLEVVPRTLAGESVEGVSMFQRQEEIDLIVVATHGYWGSNHFPLGSFAARVLRFVSCPVLVFRALPHSGRIEEFKQNRILVPYDFSRPATYCMEVARSWARAYGASVRLLTVVEPYLNLYGDSILTEEDLAIPNQKLEARAVSRLEHLIQAEWKGVQAQARVRLGHPAQEILEEIGEFRPDLVIMASRGLSLDPIPLGSVTERTIHEAPCPVLVVKL